MPLARITAPPPAHHTRPVPPSRGGEHRRFVPPLLRGVYYTHAAPRFFQSLCKLILYRNSTRTPGALVHKLSTFHCVSVCRACVGLVFFFLVGEEISGQCHRPPFHLFPGENLKRGSREGRIGAADTRVCVCDMITHTVMELLIFLRRSIVQYHCTVPVRYRTQY